MYRIVYISEAVRPMTEVDVDAIVNPARTFNAQRGVTGLLVYAQQSFLQVIEAGSEEVIEETYAQVIASQRHRNLRRTPIFTESARSFPDWSMGFTLAAPRDVVQVLLEPLVKAGHVSHQQAAGILLARFAALAEPDTRVRQAIIAF